MRHGKKFNHLGRKTGHRKALLQNMSISLILHKRIKTTLAKAKALRVHAEPIITKCKDNSTHSRRVVFSYLQNKEAAKELFETVREKIGDRPGGYLRIIKTGFRQGDGAEMAIIEFVDFNETMLANKESGTGTKKKSRRRGGKKKEANEVVENAQEAAEDVVEDATNTAEGKDA